MPIYVFKNKYIKDIEIEFYDKIRIFIFFSIFYCS